MSSKKDKRIKKANKYIKTFVEDNLIGGLSISDFTPYSSSEDAYISYSPVYSFEAETGTHTAYESWSIYYKDSGKVDKITNLYTDESDSRELGDTYFSIELKKYKKFCKAWKKRFDEFTNIIEEDGISYLSSSNEAYNLINWLDDLPGTQKGEYSSYISFGNDEFYFA